MRFSEIVSESVDEIYEAGAGLNRLLQHINDGNKFIMMSAYRPEYSSSENAQRMKQLKVSLQTSGFGVVRLEGVWEGESEPSFFAIKNPNRSYPTTDSQGAVFDTAVRLGQQFEQDAVIVGDGENVLLVDQSGDILMTFDAATIDRRDLERLPGKSRIKGKSFSLVQKDDPEMAATGHSRVDVARSAA